MKKILMGVALVGALVVGAIPAGASEGQGEHKSSAGSKHNFDQWQTIKRLQIVR